MPEYLPDVVPRTPAEDAELKRRYVDTDEFEVWAARQGFTPYDDVPLEYVPDEFGRRIALWQSEVLGELRALALPGMEETA